MIFSNSQALLQSSFDSAENLIKDRAVSFYDAFSLLPQDLFRAVAVVYAFCRTADDIADQAQPSETEHTLQRLLDLEDMIKTIFSKKDDRLLKLTKSYQNFSWLPAFVHTIERFDLPMKPFLDQLEGQRMDVSFSKIENMDQLITYSRKVAGSVGVMLLPLFVLDRETANMVNLREACEHLGIAMQITNILRDVGEDLSLRNRVYLPETLLLEYGITTEMLRILVNNKNEKNIDVPLNFIQMWEHLAEIADDYYRDIEAWLCYIHPDCRIPLLASARIYRAIANAVRSNGYNCFTVRCYTSHAERVAIRQEIGRVIQLLDC